LLHLSLYTGKLLSKYGVKFDNSDWLLIKGCTEKQFYDLVYAKFNIKIPREELILQGRNFIKKIFSTQLTYMDGFKNVHSILNKHYKLALVTSTGPDLVNHIDGLLSIYKKFDLVINSSDSKLHKPSPDPYLVAMNRLNLKPNECIVIEDSIQGIKSGKAAGCSVVALEGSSERKLLKQADYIISNFKELKQYLINQY